MPAAAPFHFQIRSFPPPPPLSIQHAAHARTAEAILGSQLDLINDLHSRKKKGPYQKSLRKRTRCVEWMGSLKHARSQMHSLESGRSARAAR